MILSAEEFVRLRQSEDPSEYDRAAHDDAPLAVWFDVVARFPEWREWVVHNKTVPIAVLENLASDSDSRVRAAVAEKRKLTTELQARLSADRDASVRARLACNAKCSDEILRALSQDSEEFVRSAAISKLRERESAL